MAFVILNRPYKPFPDPLQAAATRLYVQFASLLASRSGVV